MGFWTQLSLLLWKNFTLRIRQPVRMVLEIVGPLCLFLIMVAVRLRPDLKLYRPECHFSGKAMPSTGTLPFLQSYVCNFNNTCHQQVNDSLSSFNNSLLSIMVADIQSIFAKESKSGAVIRLVEDIQTFREMTTLIEDGSSVGKMGVSGLFENPERVQREIMKKNISLSPEAVDNLLNSSLALNRVAQNGDLRNMTDFGLLFINSSTSSDKSSLNKTSADLRRQVCEDKALSRFLDFENQTQAVSLENELCNLSPEEGAELLGVLGDQFDTASALSEVRNFTSLNTGTTPNLDLETVETLSGLASNVDRLQNVQQLSSELSEALINVDSHIDKWKSSSDVREDDHKNHTLSKIFCGHQNPIFSLVKNQQYSSRKSDKDDSGAELRTRAEEDLVQGLTGSCRELFGVMNQSAISRMLWRQLKPIVLGIIPYAPDTPAARKIIKQANRTFNNLGTVVTLAEQWLTTVSPALYDFMDNNPNIKFLRKIVLNGKCHFLAGATNDMPQLNDDFCDTMALFLANDGPYSWKGALRAVDYMANITRTYGRCFRFDKFQPYASEAHVERASVPLIKNKTFWAAVIFEDFEYHEGDTPPTFVKYKIRMNADNVDSTKVLKSSFWQPGLAAFGTKYTTYGFAFIQDMVDHAIIRIHGNVSQEEGVITQQFPYPCWIDDKFVTAISTTMPLIMVISWIYSVAMIIKGVVHEKETRVKELMKIMGLGNAVHWLAWFINALLMMLITIFLFCFTFKVGRVLEYSDPTVVFIFMLAFTVATIALCFLISVFFSRANLAAACGGFIYLVAYLPHTQMYIFEQYITTPIKIFACLSSNVAFGLGCSYITQYEQQAVGAHWSNFGESPVPTDTFSLQLSVVMMVVDTALYLALTCYIEAVFPGEYGIPLKWYFPLQRSYWCGNRYKESSNGVKDVNQSATIGDIPSGNNLEEEPSGLTLGVAVRNLRKVYSMGKKVAVDGLTINFYEDQITSFLGHNGAGKTTTMSILTGLFPPSGGTAYIYGKDIQTSFLEIRHSLGMCPQHNVLFEHLSVEEHIWFYARLKGLTETEVEREMPQMIQDIGLPHKRKDLSGNLSGGMKRKLSVAIAFVGGSRTVILDEPTAGVDPFSRRSIWELLLKLKKGRTVILSTHHMDEADVLGDRIAIISHGKLVAIGSSLFLKNRFGSGYYLTMVRSQFPLTSSSMAFPTSTSTTTTARDGNKEEEDGRTANGVPSLRDEGYKDPSNVHVDTVFPDGPEDEVDAVREDEVDAVREDGGEESRCKTSEEEEHEGGPDFSLDRLKTFVKKYVPDAKLVEDNNMEFCFQLPERASSTSIKSTKSTTNTKSTTSIDKRKSSININRTINRNRNSTINTIANTNITNDTTITISNISSTTGATTNNINSNTNTLSNNNTNSTTNNSNNTRNINTACTTTNSNTNNTPTTTSNTTTTAAAAPLATDGGCESSTHLAEMLAELEKVHEHLGVSSFGISDTSLEEVFLKVTDDNDPIETEEERCRVLEELCENGQLPMSALRRPSLAPGRRDTVKLLNNQDDNGGQQSIRDEENARLNAVRKARFSVIQSDSTMDSHSFVEEYLSFAGAGSIQLSGCQLALARVVALLIKRWHHLRRSKKSFVSEFILPAAFVCLAMIFSRVQPPLEHMPPLELHPWHYEPTKGDNNSLFTFYANDNPEEGRSSQLEDILLNSGTYHGVRCMDTGTYTIEDYPCLVEDSLKFSSQSPITGNTSLESPDCSCDTGFPECPAGAGGPTPPQRYLPVNDVMYNLTGRNISDWLVKTTSRYVLRRLGGFVFGEENRQTPLNVSDTTGTIDRITTALNNGTAVIPEQFISDLEEIMNFAVKEHNARVWFNKKGWVSIVAYMNSLNNVILRSYVPGRNHSRFGIVTVNHPMNFTQQQLNDESLMTLALDVLEAICVIFAMSFVPASFTLFLIEERVSNSKHMQFVSGVNPVVYWTSNFLWDMMNYSVPAVLCIVIFFVFGEDAYTSPKNAPCLVALLFLYGWAITPMMYPFSRLFSVPSSAFVVLSCMNIFLGSVTTLSTFILEVLQSYDEALRGVNNILKNVFVLLPHYCLGKGLIEMSAHQLKADILARYGEILEYDVFEWAIVGHNVFFLFIQGIVFFLLNVLMEFNCFIKCARRPCKGAKHEEEDPDVARERQRVLSGEAQHDIVRLENLSKVYWAAGRKEGITAVNQLCLGVPAGQCFGLLGVNGAGKTTTFKMLTGHMDISGGDAYINGFRITSDMVKVRQFMGYCPQFDALDPLLTAREHLEFYARIRGIPWRDVKSVASWAIKKLGLSLYADKVSSSYSGGNKRKLSTAIALIGNPPVIFLDEPTTSMDPKARRFLWKCINNIIKSGHSVILTSHSMEECEAMCARLAIMVNGAFKCIGSIQHLKNRFGDGYSINLRVAGGTEGGEGEEKGGGAGEGSGEAEERLAERVRAVKGFMAERFRQAVLQEHHHNMLQYHLPCQGLSLARLFSTLETAKRQLGVEDYSVSQTTLDQVFVNFAQMQTDLLDYGQINDARKDAQPTEDKPAPKVATTSNSNNSRVRSRPQSCSSSNQYMYTDISA